MTRDGTVAFRSVAKSPLNPPEWVFPVVWTILYILMGVGAGRVWKSAHPDRRAAIALWAVQLLINYAWSFLFFTLQSYLIALLWLALLWALVVAMILVFCRIDRAAGLLQISYLLWLSFAAYLNACVWILNRA